MRKPLLEHDLAITAWALCIMPDVRKDVAVRMNGDHREAIERVIRKLFAADPTAKIHLVIHNFWVQFKHFQNQTGKYSGNPGRWLIPEVDAGKSYVWHDLYSTPYYKELGHIACRTTSKLLGIGSAERSWGDVKHLKTGKRSHLSGSKIEKQAILYSTARITEARIKRAAMEGIEASPHDAMWGDDDLKFDLQLESFGVDTSQLKQPAVQRIFYAWVEDWETELINKNDCVAEAKLVQKYKDLTFYDPDNKTYYTVYKKNLEWQRGRGGGWHVIGIPTDNQFDDEPFPINAMTIELIAETKQASHVEVIRRKS